MSKISLKPITAFGHYISRSHLFTHIRYLFSLLAPVRFCVIFIIFARFSRFSNKNAAVHRYYSFNLVSTCLHTSRSQESAAGLLDRHRNLTLPLCYLIHQLFHRLFYLTFLTNNANVSLFWNHTGFWYELKQNALGSSPNMRQEYTELAG